MKLKRYIAPNMRQAMAMIKADHGDDAVIMSSKQVPEGVEVVAATDPEIEDYRQQAASEPPIRPMNHPYRNEFSQERPSIDPAVNFNLSTPMMNSSQPLSQTKEIQPDSSADIQRMSDELKMVRSLLENQLSSLAWGQDSNINPENVEMLKKLLRLGFGWEMAEQILTKAAATGQLSWARVLVQIELMIPVAEQDIIDEGGVVALVGPTGVGKTTTIAKIASRFVMRNSPNDLALITTDCYKIGAQAQLKTFAELLQVPVYVANNLTELNSLLDTLASKKLILVDTAGMSQRDLQMSAQLTSSEHGSQRVANYLVVSAGTQLNVLNDVVNSFAKMNLQGCILTKLDEALQLGSVLSALIEKTLPMTYLSSGQRVPEDLELVRPRDLVDRAVVLGQQYGKDIDEKALKMGLGREILNG